MITNIVHFGVALAEIEGIFKHIVVVFAVSEGLFHFDLVNLIRQIVLLLILFQIH